MAKPIYCNLFLLVLCLIYEAYGNRHYTHQTTFPSHRFSNSFGPYGSSLTAETEANGAVADAPATPPSRFRKSFSLRNPLGYERNRGLERNNESLRGLYYRQQPNVIDSGDQNNDKISNIPSSRFLKTKSPSGLSNRNNLMDLTSRNPNIGKSQNSETSTYQDIPGVTRTKSSQLARGKARQKSLPLPPNEDDSQRIGVGNDYSSMMSPIKKSLFDGGLNGLNGLNGQNVIFKSFRRCCINNDCRILKDGEECNVEDYFKNKKTKEQSNNPMFTTSSNGDNDFSDIMSKFKLFGQNSFNSLGGNKNRDDLQETGKPTNMGLGSMGFLSSFSSIGSNNGMGSNFNMPQKAKPIDYPQSEPFDMTEDEANEVRDQVLQKSNLYREKHNLDPFIMDDQLTNCAQDWANELARLNTFNHRDNNAYGENLYASSEINDLGEKAVQAWYNEITLFNIDDDESGLSTNTATHHMTQLLWKSSKKLGVGVSRNSNGMYNVVANYDPAGNMMGSFKENLPDIQQEDVEEAKESKRLQEEQERSLRIPQWNFGQF